MKNITTALLLFIVITATAQREHPQGDDLSAEQHATLHTKKLTLALALNASQRDNVYQIVLEQAQKRKARHDKRTSQNKSKLTKEERFARKNEQLDSKIAMQEKMKNILTEEQFKVWRTMRHKKHRRKGHSNHRNSREKH